MARGRGERVGRPGGALSGPAAMLGVAGGWFAAGLLAGRRSRDLSMARAELAVVREEADAAERRITMLEQVGDAVRDLLSSPRTRDEVCKAAIELAGAHAAIIYEPRDAQAGALVCTAAAGLAFGDGEVVLDVASRARWAFDVARPVFLAGAREDRVSSVELWRAAGQPASVLYQPMVRSGRTLGVLAAGWREVVPFDGSQCAAVALLAQEAAAVIAHADAIDTATGMVRTDPLTGLPNRHGLRVALGEAMTGTLAPGTPTVAMLELDDLAAYREANGHAAGDRLLKSTVSSWQSALRPGDVLARFDAERFVVLLGDGDARRGVTVAERLRALAPDGGRCCAGVAGRRSGEAGEALVTRARETLLAVQAGPGAGVRSGEEPT